MPNQFDDFARTFVADAMFFVHGESGVIVKPPGSHPIELHNAVVHSEELFTDFDDDYEKVSEILVVKIEFDRKDIDERFLPLSDRTTVSIAKYEGADFVVRAEESNLTASLCTLVVERRTLQRRHELRRNGAT